MITENKPALPYVEFDKLLETFIKFTIIKKVNNNKNTISGKLPLIVIQINANIIPNHPKQKPHTQLPLNIPGGDGLFFVSSNNEVFAISIFIEYIYHIISP